MSFSSGSAANAPWQYSHTFNTPGTYNYRCDIHFASGMTGSITVTPSGSPDQVVISEIMYNNPGTDTYEYVELHNNGSSPVNMAGWSYIAPLNGPMQHTDSSQNVVSANVHGDVAEGWAGPISSPMPPPISYSPRWAKNWGLPAPCRSSPCSR